MQNEEIIKKAMSNRQPISFQYRRIGKDSAENIQNARVILLKTDALGRDSVMVEALNRRNLWRYFDLKDMSGIQISAIL